MVYHNDKDITYGTIPQYLLRNKELYSLIDELKSFNSEKDIFENDYITKTYSFNFIAIKEMMRKRIPDYKTNGWKWITYPYYHPEMKEIIIDIPNYTPICISGANVHYNEKNYTVSYNVEIINNLETNYLQCICSDIGDENTPVQIDFSILYKKTTPIPPTIEENEEVEE